MAKFNLKIKARKLREKGESIRDIAKLLKVSKDSVSIWCRDINLSNEQVTHLLERKRNKLRLGQINGAMSNKNKRLKKIEFYKIEGSRYFKKVPDKEFFIAGLALYIGEGSKKDGWVSINNSDPRVMKFMLRWLYKFFSVSADGCSLSIIINEINRDREKIVRRYWSTYLKVPLTQFRGTTFIKSAQKKVYDNYDNHYGVLRIRVLKSREMYYKIMGLIGGLLEIY